MRPTAFGSDSLCAEKSATLGTEGEIRSKTYPHRGKSLISKDLYEVGSGGRDRTYDQLINSSMG
jgi:hypothetical protein